MKGEIIVSKGRAKWRQVFGALMTDEDIHAVVRCDNKREAMACVKSLLGYRKRGEYEILRATRVGSDVYIYDKWYEPQLKMSNGMRNLNLINWDTLVEIEKDYIHFTRIRRAG